MANLSNINNKLLVGTNGEVRIGDTATVANVKLRVKQTAQQWTAQFVNTDSSVAYGISIDTSASSYGVAGTLQCYTNAGGGFIVRNDSRVGIGTTGPLALLNIEGSNNQDQNDYAQLYIKGTGTYPDDIAGIVLDSVGSHQSHVRFSNNGSPKFQLRYNQGSNTIDKLTFYSFTQGNDMMTLDGATGNVGIGTYSPSATLELNSTTGNAAKLRVGRQTTATNYLELGTNGGDSVINAIGIAGVNATLVFNRSTTTTTTESMRITSVGNILVGGSNDYSRISVTNGLSTRTGITLSDGNTASLMLFAGNNSDAVIAIDTQNLSFKTGATVGQDNGTERMRIDSSGEVLVGVTSNQTESKLTSRQNGSSIEFGHLNQSSGYYGTLGAMYSSGRPFLAFSCDSSPTSAGNNFATRGFKGNVIFSETNGNLIFSQATNANSASQALTERMRIDSSGNSTFTGNVNINGTTGTPSISVKNSSSGGNNEIFQRWQYVPNNTNFRLDLTQRETAGLVKYAFDLINNGTAYNSNLVLDRGNVGIGTDDPDAKLDVKAGATATQDDILWGVQINNEGNGAATNYGAGLKFKNSSSVEPYKWSGIAGVAGSGYSNATDLAFYASSNSTADAVERMRIKGGGDIQIPTNSASLQLRSSGSGAYTSIRRDAANQLIVANTAGNQVFGIGNGGELAITNGASYTTTLTYTTGWNSSYQTLIPGNSLSPNAVYIVTIKCDSFGTPPYYASTVFHIATSPGTNGSGGGNDNIAPTATHVNSTVYWKYRLSTVVSGKNGVEAYLSGGPTPNGTNIYVKATKIMTM